MRICELNKDEHVLREKELLDSLRFRHLNIINLMSTFKDSKNLYFVFEFAPNGTIDDLIRKCHGSIPENAVKILFAQLVNFMEFIQKEGIMHRDLKTQNIMLDENYNIKIIDFGEAKKVAADKNGNYSFDNIAVSSHDKERKDTFVGTINYQAPEMITGEAQGFPLDTWALGVILFKMLVGQVPFKGTNPKTVYKDIRDRKIGWPDKSTLNEIMSKEAQDLINRIL